MQNNVHSPNFEKCVCLTISVSSTKESQLHQSLLHAEFKLAVLKEIRAYLDPIQFYMEFSNRPSSKSSKWRYLLHVMSRLESLLGNNCPTSDDISQPLLFPSGALWLVPDSKTWQKWRGAPRPEWIFSLHTFFSFLLLSTEDLKHC